MSAALRFRGAIEALDPDARRRLTARDATGRDPELVREVAAILERVRRDGDRALFGMARAFDGVDMKALEVDRDAPSAALDALEPSLRRAMERAARNLETVHRALLPQPVAIEVEPGITVGRRPDPLARVGIYAPGGRAAYPSSVLMGAVPARVAGVGEVVLCTPPGRDGQPAPTVLAAAAIAGVDRVFAIGGAGAVAAMAFGTASVPRVDRIVGPGNAWVAEAKMQVGGAVPIDAPAGPSELLAVADGSADAVSVARELAAQAEHAPDSIALAVTVGERAAAGIEAALEGALDGQPRRVTIAEALAARGGVLWTRTLEEALDFASRFAPEHLLLAVADPDDALARVRNAGAVFLGARSSVAFGDYMTGANHTLPTGGAASAWSGLSTLDFVRWTSWQRVGRAAAERLAGDVVTFARAEGLPAHAAAATGGRA